MYRNIYKHISDSIAHRTNDILNHITANNKQLATLTEQILNLEHEIIEFLSDDFKTLFYDYKTLRGERNSIIDIILYKVGLMDGIKLRNMLSINTRRNFDKI